MVRFKTEESSLFEAALAIDCVWPKKPRRDSSHYKTVHADIKMIILNMLLIEIIFPCPKILFLSIIRWNIFPSLDLCSSYSPLLLSEHAVATVTMAKAGIIPSQLQPRIFMAFYRRHRVWALSQLQEFWLISTVILSISNAIGWLIGLSQESPLL